MVRRAKIKTRKAKADEKAEAVALAGRILYWTGVHDISQVELARRVRVAPSSVTAWVSGRAFPSYLVLVRLARVLPGLVVFHPAA